MNPFSLKSKLSKPKKLLSNFSTSVSGSNDQPELQVADPKAVRALVSLMDMEAVMGGAASHFGGPSALAEINSVLYALAYSSPNTWDRDYNLINDAGHCENGLYALKALYGFADLKIADLKLFRSIESPLTGHGESHLFPEGVLISNGPLGSSIGPAQGLCVGDKLKENDRVTVVTLSDGAAMEGEAKEAFASIPGLAKKGKMNPFILLISDNNTKLSGRIDEDSFSMSPTFNSLKTLGWTLKQNIDGHDLTKIYDVLTESIEESKADPTKPIAIHFKTVKGKGHKKSEESKSGGHGFPLKTPDGLREMVKEVYEKELPLDFESWISEIESRILKKPTKLSEDVIHEKIQMGLSKAFIELKNEGFPLMSVSCDLHGSTGMAAFRKEFPDSSIDIGVAESNMVSLASGLSKNGFIPVVDTFAQFGVTKGALPLTMANLSQSPVIAVYSHTGFQDAADGASHQALSYYAMVSSIPGVRVVSLSCSQEAYSLVKEVIKNFKVQIENGQTPLSTVFFLGRENFPQHYSKDVEYKLSEEVILVDQKKPKALVLTTGSLVPLSIDYAKNENCTLLSKACLNGSFSAVFFDELKKAGGNLIVIEDHQKISGFGSYALMKTIESHGGSAVKTFKSISVDSKFGRSAYTAKDLYEHYLTF